jgi:hypothetical protein
MGVVVNATLRTLYPRDKEKVPIVQEDGLAPGSVWTGAESWHLLGACIPGPSDPRRDAIPTELHRPNGQRSVMQSGGLQVLTQLLTCRRAVDLIHKEISDRILHRGTSLPYQSTRRHIAGDFKFLD